MSVSQSATQVSLTRGNRSVGIEIVLNLGGSSSVTHEDPGAANFSLSQMLRPNSHASHSNAVPTQSFYAVPQIIWIHFLF